MFDYRKVIQWFDAADEEAREAAFEALDLADKARDTARSHRTVHCFIPIVFETWTRETHKLQIEFLAECWRYGAELKEHIENRSKS